MEIDLDYLIFDHFFSIFKIMINDENRYIQKIQMHAKLTKE